MSFLTDLFEGKDSNLGNDISHAGSSLINHPDELAETAAGALALGTGGLGLAGIGPLGGVLGGAADAGAAGGGGFFGSLFGGGGDIAAAAGGGAADLSAGGTTGLAGAEVAAGGGSDSLIAGAAGPSEILSGGGDIAPSIGAPAAVNDAGIPVESAVNASGGGGGDSFLGKLGSGAISSVTKNPLGIAAAGAGLGLDLFKGNPTDPNQKVLQAQAGQLGAQGQQLMSYLSTGTLPPALKASLDQATTAAKARIVSGYASRGQPTDPNQNSALAQELNNVDTNAVAAMASAQIDMMKTGLSETGLSTQLYETLTKMDQQNNQQLMSAISSFAAALGGGGGFGGGGNFKISQA